MSIRLRSTIVTTREDWSVARFELLADFLREKDRFRRAVFAIATSNTEPLESADPLLSILDPEDFDAMWSGGIDTEAGSSLRPEECEAMSRSRRSERELLVTNKGTAKRFNLAMASAASRDKGRLIVECSLCHLPDDIDDYAIEREPVPLASVRIYVRNVAAWLALLESDESESLTWTSLGARGTIGAAA